MNKKYDFIPNRLNKYSIRKFTVGVASILVGSTLIFGLSDDAKADEIETQESATVINSDDDDSDPTEGAFDTSTPTNDEVSDSSQTPPSLQADPSLLESDTTTNVQPEEVTPVTDSATNSSLEATDETAEEDVATLSNDVDEATESTTEDISTSNTSPTSTVDVPQTVNEAATTPEHRLPTPEDNHLTELKPQSEDINRNSNVVGTDVPAIVRNSWPIGNIPTNDNFIAHTLNTGAVFRSANQAHSIGDKVWEDTNKDGIQDPDEPGIPNATVILYEYSYPDGVSTELRRTTTDENGHYSFDNVEQGIYRIGFVTPDHYLTSPTRVGSDRNIDSDAPNGFVSIYFRDLTDIDAGFYKEPTYTVGDLVWDDANINGIQDEGEIGIPNVTVVLHEYVGSETFEVARTTTDENGHYHFDNVFDGLYHVEFVTPDGYLPTEARAGEDESIDSETFTNTVSVSGDDVTVDGGFYQPLSQIGDKVWDDTNHDGIQDENEPG
ncbi:SdrD B-like domain-containing protein, partial [Staphylococcus muscae]